MYTTLDTLTTDIEFCIQEYQDAYASHIGSRHLTPSAESQQYLGASVKRIRFDPFSDSSAADASMLWQHINALQQVNLLATVELRESRRIQMYAYTHGWYWLDTVFHEAWNRYLDEGTVSNSTGFMLAIHEIVIYVHGNKASEGHTRSPLLRSHFLGPSSNGDDPTFILKRARYYTSEPKQRSQAIEMARRLAVEWLGFPGQIEDLLRYDVLHLLLFHAPPSILLLSTTWNIFWQPLLMLLSRNGRQKLRGGNSTGHYISMWEGIIILHPLANPKNSSHAALEDLNEMVNRFWDHTLHAKLAKSNLVGVLFQPSEIVSSCMNEMSVKSTKKL